MNARQRAWAIRVYRWVLAIAPRSLVERYGDEMRRTFDARLDDTAARGAFQIAALLIRESVDLIRLRRRRSAQRSASSAAPAPRRSALSRSLLLDVRYALRLALHQPGFTAVAVLTLALGIGATTAVFTVVNGVLLRALPYADPDRLLILMNGRDGKLDPGFSPPNFRDVAALRDVLANAGAFSSSTFNLTGRGAPERLVGVNVTWTFLSVVGVPPRLGRMFVEADAEPGAAAIAISDGLWRRLGARADVIGSQLQLDGRPYTVAAVMPPNAFPVEADYWYPFGFKPEQLDDSQRGARWINGLVRLKPAVTVEQANAAIAAVAARLERDYPRSNRGWRMSALPLKERLVHGVRPGLLVVLAAVGLVLVIACVNVANLLLARAAGRGREVAVRAAVGAGRARLIQQFLVESLVLGAISGAAGLLLAAWSTRALVALGTSSIPRLADVGVDWRVLAFAIATSVTTSVVFGLVPALAATGRTTLAVGGRGELGPAGTRARKLLVVCELALAVVLLVSAGLLIRSYDLLSRVPPGFSPDGVLTFRIALPEPKYPAGPAVGRFVADYVQRLAQTPGVMSAAAIFGLPLDNEFEAYSNFRRRGEPESPEPLTVGLRVITPRYLDVLRIPLRAGRIFDDRDTDTSPEVVLINEEAARRYWPGQDPIGKEIRLGARVTRAARAGWKTIVGIVGDVKYGGLDVGAPPEAYVPHAQHPVEELTIAVRAAGDPDALVPTARAQLSLLDRELPMSSVRPLTDIVRRSIAERRFMMLLVALFAAVAILLATIGVYGVLAHLVGQRTREIGLRLAIGAAPRDVVQLFLREGVTLAAIGVAIGLAGALAATRALTAMLFGVSTLDPLTFTLVGLALALATMAASYFPARRAAHVDPMTALRVDG